MEFVSKKPRKQRKFVHNLSLHQRKSQCVCHLSKELRKETGKRAVTVRTGDRVKVMRGANKKKDGKVLRVDYKRGMVFIEKIVRKKADGTEKLLPIRASNVLIVELDRNDERRLAGAAKQAKAGKQIAGAADKAHAGKAVQAEKQVKEKAKADIWAEEKLEKKEVQGKVK